MNVKKLLVLSVFTYIFYINFLIGISGISELKLINAFIIVLLFFLYFSITSKFRAPYFIYLSLVLSIFYFFLDNDYPINFFYTVIFGWILTLDYKYTIRLLITCLLIQFIFTIYEVLTYDFIYSELNTGILKPKNYIQANTDLFESTGFRSKGLFIGTLVSTSFIIYMTLLFRNNRYLIIILFLLAILTNGRLAIIICALTLFTSYFNTTNFKFFTKLKSINKFFIFTIVTSILCLLTINLIPSNNLNHLISVIDLSSSSNVGRIYSYLQSISLYSNYPIFNKLFGNPSNQIYDVWGREVASESGLLSMFLDIGLFGFIFLSILLYKLISKKSLFSRNRYYIGFSFFLFFTFISFIQYEHIKGDLRGTLLWFSVISFYYGYDYTNNNIIKYLNSRFQL